MAKTFLLQINTTRDCNLRCTHCYISTDKKEISKFMTESHFLSVFEQFAAFLSTPAAEEEYNLADIHVIGGEPTMLGYDFYARLLPQARALLSKVKQQVKLSIVTNLVTHDALRICELFDFVSTSYEIDTRFVSAKGRPLPKLEQLWINNVRTLQASGIQVNVTTAVTQQVINFGAGKLLDYFLENGFRNVHLGFFIPSGDGLINIGTVFPPFKQTSDFMIEAANWYLQRRLDIPDLYVNPIESMIESIYYKTPMDDIVCPIIPGSLDVDHDGETVTCIEAGGEVDMTSLGNVFVDGMTNILNGRAYRRERTKAIVPKMHCIGCDELENCQSACGVLHGFWNGKGECPGFKGFIKFIREQVEQKGVIPKAELQLERPAWRAC